MRWLDEEKKTGHIFILVPATQVTRNAIGLSSTQCAAKILGSPSAQFVWSTNLRILRGMHNHAVAIYTLCTLS